MSIGPSTSLRHGKPSRLRRVLVAVGVLLVAILVTLLVDRIFFANSSTRAGTGSGDAASQSRSVPPFTGVDLASDLNAKRPMFVVVTMPSLDALRLDGAGNITASGIDSPHLTVAMPGSGTIDATGTTTKLTVTMGGQGTALLRGLVARDANAALGGNGTIMLTATRSLTARISGNGTILYGGEPPHVTQSVTGNGTISPG